MTKLRVGLLVGMLALVLSQFFPVHGQERVNANNWLWDTSSFMPWKSTALATFPLATTQTARSITGVALTEKSSRWTAVSFPASGSQATASIAAETGVRHVVDCVTWGADSSAAVAASAGNIAVRDGATGAGTVIWQVAIAHGVAAGAGIQTIAPNTICGLNLPGTAATAMTAELNAGVTGEVQSVSMSGINVQ